MSGTLFFIFVALALGIARFLSAWAPEGTAHRFFLNQFPLYVYLAAVLLPLLPLVMSTGKRVNMDATLRILLIWAIGAVIVIALPAVLKKAFGAP